MESALCCLRGSPLVPCCGLVAGAEHQTTKILEKRIDRILRAEIMGQQSEAVSAVNEISFAVEGFPPAKNEALSMLGTGHSHAPRVRLLLEAARRACVEHAFVPVEKGYVSLDVVLRATADEAAWDATNYLGGIADVLEDKSHRCAIEHLRDLADVWLYRNDRQIKQITYRERESDKSGYTVTVRTLTGLV